MIFPSTHIELERAFCNFVGIAGWNTAVNAVKSSGNRALLSQGASATAMTTAPYFTPDDLRVIGMLAPDDIMFEVRKVIMADKTLKVTA